MQTVNVSTFDLPYPFLRKGIDRSEVKELTSDADYKSFESTVGTTFTGYGFVEGEYVLIPNLPNKDPDKTKRKRILQVPKAPGSENMTGLVSVVRFVPVSGGYKRVVSWLNTARLSEMSFVDRTYTDSFREGLSMYNNDLDRLDAITGHLLLGSSPTEVSTYKFEDGKRAVDENGDYIIEKVQRVTVEDQGVIKDESKLPFTVVK